MRTFEDGVRSAFDGAIGMVFRQWCGEHLTFDQSTLNIKHSDLIKRTDQLPPASAATFRYYDAALAEGSESTANDHWVRVQHLRNPF